MDYDKLVEQRRRNWDALKPEDIRKREREEERERKRKEREEKGKATNRDKLDRQKAAADEIAEKEFALAKRQAMMLGGIFLLAVVVVSGISWIYQYRVRAAYLQQIEETSRAILDGKEFQDLSDPVSALATWRSSWMNGNMEQVVEMTAGQEFERIAGNRGRSEVITDYERRLEAGGLDHYLNMAIAMDNPEIIRIPTPPWNEGELAIFRSDYIQRIDEPSPGRRFIASFSWEPRSGEWRFADVREARYFDVDWTRITAIDPMKGGPMAVQYDEHGDRIAQERP